MVDILNTVLVDDNDDVYVDVDDILLICTVHRRLRYIVSRGRVLPNGVSSILSQ